MDSPRKAGAFALRVGHPVYTPELRLSCDAAPPLHFPFLFARRFAGTKSGCRGGVASAHDAGGSADDGAHRAPAQQARAGHRAPAAHCLRDGALPGYVRLPRQHPLLFRQGGERRAAAARPPDVRPPGGHGTRGLGPDYAGESVRRRAAFQHVDGGSASRRVRLPSLDSAGLLT